MKTGELKVHYKVEDGIDPAIDNAIAEALLPFGYKRWASGADFPAGIRDLAFDKKD